MSYTDKKIIRETLNSPTALNALISSAAERESHDFTQTLFQEAEYLSWHFVNHSELLSTSEVRQHIKSRMEDADFFHENYNQAEQAQLINNISMLVQFKRSLSQLKLWSELKFSKESAVHEDKLRRLWDNLAGYEMPDRISQDWVNLGFQGKDPATDFRGAGILGLDNLLAITDKDSQYYEQAQEMYSSSINPTTWYFFAVTGINITQKLLQEFLHSHHLDQIILENIEVLLKLKQSRGTKLPESDPLPNIKISESPTKS